MHGGTQLLYTTALYFSTFIWLTTTSEDVQGSCTEACVNLVTPVSSSQIIGNKGCTLSWDELYPNNETKECERRCANIVKERCDLPEKCNFQRLPESPCPPYLLHSNYTTITLQWNSSTDDLLYVLHAQSNQSQTSSLEILPFVPEYYFIDVSNHTNSLFTLDNLLAETSYKFRISAIRQNGVTSYSEWSLWYETNNECNRTSRNVSTTIVFPSFRKITEMIHFPCPVTNVKLNVSFVIVEKNPVVLHATLFWKFPPGLDNIKGKQLHVTVTLLPHPNATMEELCKSYHDYNFDHTFIIESNINDTRNYFHLFNKRKSGSPKQSIHFGCRYSAKLRVVIADTPNSFDSKTIFHIPECINNVQSCPIQNPDLHTSGEIKSKHIEVKIKPSPLGNYTAVITWFLDAWAGLPTVEFFHVTIGEWPDTSVADFYLTENVNTTQGSSIYELNSKNMPEGITYRVVVRAYHGKNCLHDKIERETFKIIEPCKGGCQENRTCSPNDTYDGSASCECKSGFTLDVNKTFCIVAPLPSDDPQASQNPQGGSTDVAVIVVPLVVIAVIAFVVAALLWRWREKQKRVANNIFNSIRIHGARTSSSSNSNLYRQYPSMTDSEFLGKRVDMPEEREANVLYVPQEIQHAIACGLADGYELSAEKLRIGSRLGKGAFGNVYHAEAQGISEDPTQWTPVAVKTLSEKAIQKGADEFIEEIELMKLLGEHENVITMVGCCTLTLPICLILEYAPYGNLQDYLRSLRTNLEKNSIELKKASPDKAAKDDHVTHEIQKKVDEPESLLKTSEKNNDANLDKEPPKDPFSIDGVLDASELESFALQIANGMTYVTSRGIVHRDLAARNVLIGENRVLKISDFGLSREGVYVKTTSGKIPLRWLSVEAMRERMYSSASDIWAFGIVLWEICTLGGFPYPMIPDSNLLAFLENGKRLEKPTNCTDEIYGIMLQCWKYAPEERPTFGNLRDLLWKLKTNENAYVNVDPLEDFEFPPMDEGDCNGNTASDSETFENAIEKLKTEPKNDSESTDLGQHNPVFRQDSAPDPQKTEHTKEVTKQKEVMT